MKNLPNAPESPQLLLEDEWFKKPAFGAGFRSALKNRRSRRIRRGGAPLLILVSVFSGCAFQIIDIPVSESAVGLQVVGSVEKNEANLIRSGNITFANRSIDVYRDVLVFNGHHGLNEIIVRGNDGFPRFDFYNIGRFIVSPASAKPFSMYGERLVGTFRQAQEYTLLIASFIEEAGSKKTICVPQIYHGRINSNIFGEEYIHPIGDKIVKERVSNLVFLPDADVSNRDFSNVPADLDFDSMLRRGIHRIMPRR